MAFVGVCLIELCGAKVKNEDSLLFIYNNEYVCMWHVNGCSETRNYAIRSTLNNISVPLDQILPINLRPTYNIESGFTFG